jgi:hypothetical protein
MPSHCPTCGAALNGRSICPRCGTLAGIEFGIANVYGRAKLFFETRIVPLPQSFRPHHFLWACAIMPIFMLPPLVSLVSSIATLRRLQRNAEFHDYEWIAIVSAINLILSGMLLYKFHVSMADIISRIEYYVWALFHPLQFVPEHAPRATEI